MAASGDMLIVIDLHVSADQAIVLHMHTQITGCKPDLSPISLKDLDLDFTEVMLVANHPWRIGTVACSKTSLCTH
jgi:hypothetical protein